MPKTKRKTSRNKKYKKVTKKTKRKTKSLSRYLDSLPDRNTAISNKRSLIKKLKERYKIIDVEFSTERSKGTAASLGDIYFHYQNYSNVINFLKTLKNINACFFVNSREFLNLNIDKQKMVVKTKDNELIFKYDLMRCLNQTKYSFIPIVLNLITQKEGNHANILLINIKNKVIELYEPHGSRTSSSELDSVVGAYNKKIRALKNFWKDILPDYKVINAMDYRRGTHFQMEYDPEKNSGFCVTWSILFANYRMINPHVDLKILIKYLSLKITTMKLVQYAKHVEDTIKNKL